VFTKIEKTNNALLSIISRILYLFPTLHVRVRH